MTYKTPAIIVVAFALGMGIQLLVQSRMGRMADEKFTNLESELADSKRSLVFQYDLSRAQRERIEVLQIENDKLKETQCAQTFKVKVWQE